MACLRWSAIAALSFITGFLLTKIRHQAEESLDREYYINGIYHANNRIGFVYLRLRAEVQGLIDENTRLEEEIRKTKKIF